MNAQMKNTPFLPFLCSIYIVSYKQIPTNLKKNYYRYNQHAAAI